MLFQSGTNGSLEVAGVVRHEVGQRAEFGMTPTWFDGVEFRSVGGQPLEVDIPDARGSQPFRCRAMNLPTIPTDYQRPSQRTTQPLHEGDDFLGANMVVVNLKRRADLPPRGREGNRSNDAQSIVAVPGPLPRCFTTRSPRAAIHRLQTKARFIDKDNAGAEATGLFLIRGQSLARHCSTATPSCSRATCWGFCGLYPKSCSIRPTWSGWYDTPNLLRTTSATRAVVHKSVRYPASVGPAAKIVTNPCRWSSDNLGMGPGCGLAAKAATPPSCHARLQRFTLERLAPTSRTTSARGFRSWKYSAARRRRASSSAALPLVLINSRTVLAPLLVQLPRSFQ